MDGSDNRADLLDAGWHDQSAGIAQLSGMVRRQFWPASSVFLASVLAGLAYIVFAEPLYTASSSIYAEVEGVAATEASSLMQLDTHVELVRSDRTTAAAVNQLGLEEIFRADPGTFRRAVADVRRWLKLQVEEGPANDQTEILRLVQSGLSVERVGNTAIIDISYTSPSKDLSVAIANTFASTYIDEVADRAADTTERRLRQLQDRVDEIRRRATAAAASVQRLRFQNNLVVTNAQDLDQQITDLRRRLSLVNADEAVARAKLALLPAAGNLDGLQTAALQTPQSVETYNSFLGATAQLAQLRANPAASEATIGQLEAWVAERRGALEQELRQFRDSLDLELAVIAARRTSVLGEMERVIDYGDSTAWAELLHAERESDVYETLYQDYLNNLESAYRERQTLDVRLISEALPPLNPSAPNYKMVLAFSVVFGVVVGGALAMYREWTRRAGQFDRR